MEHIFIINSNITYFAAYKHIKKILNSGCTVTVLLTRGQKLIDDQLNVKTIDFSSLPTLDNPSHPVRNITDFFNKSRVKHAYDEKIHSVVKKSEFTLYTPNFNGYISYSLAFNKLCKGYYYIEEGTLAYSSLEYINKKSHVPLMRKIRLRLFGFKDYSMLYVNEKFKGVISISEYAFKWNNKEKYVYNPVDALDTDVSGKYKYDIIIVTDNMVTLTSDMFINILNEIHRSIKSNKKIGIKFHPQTYMLDSVKNQQIQNYITKNIENVTILPKDYIVEKSIFLYHSLIISVNTLSSLSLYSSMNGCHTLFYYLNKGNVEHVCFDCFNKYLEFLEKRK